jgi:drug/metabolite transporter (DMT)-like permease
MVVLLWGGSYPAIKATQPFFPPVAFATFRCAVAAVILVAVGLTTGGLRAGLRPRDWGVVVLLGVLGNTLFHILMVSAVHHTSPSHAAILVALSPVLAALLARLLFREPLGPRRLGGIALGFAGVALIVTRGDPGSSSALGDLLSLGASLSWALYTVIGKPLLARSTPLAVTTWATLIGVVPMLPFGAPGLGEVRWGALTPGRWLLLLYLSAGTIALANLLWYMALARTATARVVAFSFLIPLIAAAIAVLAGQETLTLSLGLGAAAVLGGVALTHRA